MFKEDVATEGSGSALADIQPARRPLRIDSVRKFAPRWMQTGQNGFVLRELRARARAIVQSVRRCHDLYVFDISLAAFTILLAAGLRLGPESLMDSHAQLQTLALTMFVFAGICAVTFPIAGLYQRNWKYASLLDYFVLARAVLIAALVLTAALFFYSRLDFVPRTTVAIAAMILVAALGLSRLRFRHEDIRALASPRKWSSAEFECLVPILLVGTGPEADLYLRALQRDRSSTYWPVGFLDGSAREVSTLVRGVPVLGTFEDFEAVYADLDARGQKPRHMVFTTSLSKIDAQIAEKLVQQAERLGMAVSRLRPATELRRTSLTQEFEVRPIELTDLLERSQASLDVPALRRFIEGRTVLVTGAGGSIGSELSRQIASLGPRHLVLLDNSELNLYSIGLDISETYPALPRTEVLCDVRNPARLNDVFANCPPDIVFHAAALKHVPMVELNPCEGVLTNVIGTMNVAEASKRWGVLGMVQISTDKVVNSTSVMGATKRLGELYCQAMDLEGLRIGKSTRFLTVRFGNVLGSSGSLIPLFKRQIARGGPLTVTHPDMKRFFMTIREAAELTLQASAYGLEKQLGKGEIFVLDMGEPIKIVDIARRMIRLAGYEPDCEIQIKIVGLRPGEKLFEELFDRTDTRVSAPVPGVFGAVPVPVPLPHIYQVFERLRTAAERGDVAAVFQAIGTILPGFRPDLHKPGPRDMTPSSTGRRHNETHSFRSRLPPPEIRQTGS